MREEITLVTCDGCKMITIKVPHGQAWENQGYDFVIQYVTERGWHEDHGWHHCPHCKKLFEKEKPDEIQT